MIKTLKWNKTSINVNLLMKIMMSYYRLDNNLSQGEGINYNFDWYVMNHSCELVDDNQDWVIDLAFLIGGNR